MYQYDIIEHFNLKENLQVFNDMDIKQLYQDERLAMCDITDFINQFINGTIYDQLQENNRIDN